MLKPILIILIVTLTSCEPDPISLGVLTIQNAQNSNYDSNCPREAIITNISTNKIITFAVEITSRESARKGSKEFTILPGATKWIAPSCGLVFTVKGAFYEKENSKRVETE